MLAFTIPRVPSFSTNGQNPLVSATGWFNQSIPAEFSRSPANFSFAANMPLQVDTGSNFLPLTFKHLDAQVYDLDSFNLVGHGHVNRTTLPANHFSDITMPLNFTYVATNDSDQTCQSCASSVVFSADLLFSRRDQLVQCLQESYPICQRPATKSVVSPLCLLFLMTHRLYQASDSVLILS